MILYAFVLLLMYIGAIMLGLYAWWTGGFTVGLFVLALCFGFSVYLSLPLVLINIGQQLWPKR
ncbi:MAG: hypothetical protein ACXWAS_14985 [Methylobacter sp.]